MRVEVKEVENKGFKPFKIEIEIETLAELKELHNRMNICDNTVNDGLGNDWCNDHLFDLFSIVHDELISKDMIH